VLKKWTGIKDNYAKYVKKLKEINKSGAGASKLKEYHLYKQLLFLKRNDQNETDDSIIDLEINNQDTQKESPKRKFKSPSLPQSSRKRRNVDTFEEEIMAKLEEPENRHLSFFKAILPSLNELNDHQTLVFQSRVLNILTDLYEQSQQRTSIYYSQSNCPSSYQGNYESQRPQSSWQSSYHGGYQTAGSSTQSTREAALSPAAQQVQSDESVSNDYSNTSREPIASPLSLYDFS
jgi:hypothetical protein